MEQTRVRRPKPCRMCGEFDSTDGENVVERRRIDVPGGRWVHFACLGDWLIDSAMDEWLGPMRSHERAVMRERLGLPSPARRTLPSLKAAAGNHGYTGAWLSSQVQGPALRHLQVRIEAAEAKPTVEAEEQQRHDRIRSLAEEIVELVAGPLRTRQ